jgi:hypothetical protein
MNTNPPEQAVERSADAACSAVQSFRSDPIRVSSKTIFHEEQVAIVGHFLMGQKKHLRAALRDSMVALAALGHQFTQDEWAKSMDSYTEPNAAPQAPANPNAMNTLQTNQSGCLPEPCYVAGDSVKLTTYHKDNRPTTIRFAGPESCVLEERRSGYYCWNYADIEPHNALTETQP